MKPFLILFVLLTIVHAKTAERHSNSKNRQRTQRTPSIEVNSATSGSSKTIGHSVDYDHFLEEGSMLPYFPEKVNNVTVTIGQNAELRCAVDNLNNYKVAWVSVDSQTILSIHNNVITRNPRISLSRPSSNQWHLHIQRAKQSDRGWYMCQINTDPMVHRSGYLEVVVPPRILNKDDEGDLVVREGDNLTLSCDAVGHPRPHIVWRREDSEDIMVEGRKAIVENRTLRIPKISRLHMADYLCVASNGIAPSTSKKYRIKVQFPPMFWIPSQLEGAYVGQDITLECHSEAFPKSINYWIKEDGAMLISGNKYESLIVDSGYKVYMKLRIRNVSKTDFMEYKCVAKNSLGGSDGSITLYEVKPPTTITTLATTTTTTTAKSTQGWFEVDTTSAADRRRLKERRKERILAKRRKEASRRQKELVTFDEPTTAPVDDEYEGLFEKFGLGKDSNSRASTGVHGISGSFTFYYAYISCTFSVLMIGLTQRRGTQVISFV
ncbi:neurotrimin-like isoform X2 [Tigriopus californicus]|uniref:neurotrimin-like isoform X2 n=1 Tax=Tigriopus californicus TaxID=6832 RepID=UPI0027DA47E9|nr:neurotrimin-like isoform X2 [Tigriopus californicus]